MKRLLFFLTVATLVSCGRTFEQRTAKYAEVGSVNDNRAAVLDINEGVGRWGYVDGTGRLVIECRYADARSFDDGLAAVQEPEGLWGYIDTAGRAVVAPFQDGGRRAEPALRGGHRNRSAMCMPITTSEGTMTSSQITPMPTSILRW